MSQRFQPVLLLLLALAMTAAVMAQPSKPAQPDQSVLTSGDIGFRVEYYEGSKPVGTLVVRVNGRWVEPKSAAGTQLLHPR